MKALYIGKEQRFGASLTRMRPIDREYVKKALLNSRYNPHIIIKPYTFIGFFGILITIEGLVTQIFYIASHHNDFSLSDFLALQTEFVIGSILILLALFLWFKDRR